MSDSVLMILVIERSKHCGVFDVLAALCLDVSNTALSSDIAHPVSYTCSHTVHQLFYSLSFKQRCKTFEQINGGGAPGWGTTTDIHPWKHTALCCAPAATQYACEATKPALPPPPVSKSLFSLKSPSLIIPTTAPVMAGTLDTHQITSTGVTLSWLPAKHEGGAPVFSYQISIRKDGEWHVLQVCCARYSLFTNHSWSISVHTRSLSSADSSPRASLNVCVYQNTHSRRVSFRV